jgi:hypothetical protein
MKSDIVGCAAIFSASGFRRNVTTGQTPTEEKYAFDKVCTGHSAFADTVIVEHAVIALTPGSPIGSNFAGP